MKLIIVEGIDKCGKTTMVNSLYEMLKSSKRKCIIMNLPFNLNKPLSEDIIQYRLRMETKNIIEMSKSFGDEYLCLIDRYHLSEKVYGKLLRGSCAEFECNYADAMFSGLDSLLIHIVPDEIHDNFNKFKDNDGKLDGFTFYQYRVMLDKFTDEFNRSEMNTIQLKTSEIDGFIEKIIGGEIC